MDDTIRRLSQYSIDVAFGEFSEKIVHQAVRRVVDTLGCALGGALSAPADIARRLSPKVLTGSGCHILGLGHEASLEAASLANTIMARYLDYNDFIPFPSGSHPSDCIPAILAAGESEEKSGAEVLSAVIAAYQASVALPLPIRERGWDHGTLCGIGVAVGVGRLRGLSADQLANALAMFIVSNVSLRVTRHGELSMWKGCATAAASRSAVFAVALAAEGMTGPPRAIEGVHGLWDQLCGGPIEVQLDSMTWGFRVEQSYPKRYPAQGELQPVISAFIGALEGVEEDDVRSVSVAAYDSLWATTAREPERWNPATRETADHSLPYVLAVALRDRDVTVESFDKRNLADQRLHDLMRRVEVLRSRELDGDNVFASTRIEIVLRSGERLITQTNDPAAVPNHGVSDEQLSQKFRSLGARSGADPAEVDAVLDKLWHLDVSENVSQVVAEWSHLVRGRN